MYKIGHSEMAHGMDFEIKGLPYNKKNLKTAMESNEFRITDISHYGYANMSILDKNRLQAYWHDYNGDYNKVIMTLDEFWNNTKHRKKNIWLVRK